MAPKRCLFDLNLDLCLVKQIRPNNSVIEDIGDINSTVAIHAAGHGPAEGQGADQFLFVAHRQLPVHLLSNTLSLGIRLFCSGPMLA